MMPVSVRPMTLADLDQVMTIDSLSFPIPWSAAAYRYELTGNPAAHFLVASLIRGTAPDWRERLRAALGRAAPRPVVGYAGFWLVVDEAHIATLAVHPAWRGQGLGERLLAAMLRRALDLGAGLATLEVRVSNQTAQALYRRYGFENVGRRKNYYRDNREDALLLTAPLTAELARRLELPPLTVSPQGTP